MLWRSLCCPVCSPRDNVIIAQNEVISKMPVVRVEQGALEGVVCGSGVDEYFAFKGVPYAKPPLGKLRFKAPEPPEPWEGVRDASQHGPICPQYNERMDCIEPGSEDCLYLNVYTKSLTPSKPLPVMFWIHGGGFYTGSGNSDFYGPEFFMEHEVILVTINYRLEVLGFLCLDNEEVPGNAGLKDQVLALQWVKKNIAAFGGDPNNVTIFGCSAGAASTSYHLISKMSRGLFNKAICQSGVCLHEWSCNIYPRERALQLGKTLGKDTEDIQELLEFLRSLPAEKLVNIKLLPLYNQHMDLADSILFGPVIEKSNLRVDKFITEPPIELIKAGHMADVPTIVGFTSGEGIEISRKLSDIVGFYSLMGAVVPRELKFKWSPDKIQENDEKIRKYYFKGKTISNETLQETTNLETDRFFIYNIVRYARYHARHKSTPVYLYKFTAETERNYTKKQYGMSSVEGVCHADDLHYLFNVTCLNIPLTDESKSIIKQLVRLWTNFATTGNPTSSNEVNHWKQFNDADRNYYIIGSESKCVQNQDMDNINFWEDVYQEVCLDSKVKAT